MKITLMYAAAAISLACTTYVLILQAMRIFTRETRGELVRLSTLQQFLQPYTLVTILFNVFLSGISLYGCIHPSSGLQQQLPFVAAGFGWALAFNQYRTIVAGVNPSPRDLTGLVYLITGANAGIGYQTALALCSMGATVVMAGRSTKRMQEAKRSILDATKAAESKIICLQCDLCDFESVKTCVEEFQKLGLPLNVLINNAGMMLQERNTAANGMEMTITANHLGHYLLTLMLLPLMQQSATATAVRGRIINLTSALHHLTDGIDFDDLMAEKNYSMFPVYARSKLANVMFTVELQRRIQAKNLYLAAYAVHPGLVLTEVTRNMHWFMRWGEKLTYPLMVITRKTPVQGANNSIHVAISPDIESLGGKYFFHCEPEVMNPAAEDEEACKKLWDISAKLTKLPSDLSLA